MLKAYSEDALFPFFPVSHKEEKTLKTVCCKIVIGPLAHFESLSVVSSQISQLFLRREFLGKK